MLIDPVRGWFEITQYNDKISISIANFIETTWMSRYPRPMEITYGKGSEFIVRELSNLMKDNKGLLPNQSIL